MIRYALGALALILGAGAVAGAQLYRWVDDKGRVEWRDTPPPANAKSVEQRNVGGNTIETSGLPYNVRQAVKNFPVTLWTVPECREPCDLARKHLARRGIPYTERNGRKEQDAMKKATGGEDVPVLFVGSRMSKGYLDTDWDSALDVAGYPRTPPPGLKAQPAPSASGDSTASKPPARQP